MLKNRLLILIAAGVALVVILAGALATAGLISRGESFELSDRQVEELGLDHWSPMERWAFGKMREVPGGEVAFADFAGDGPMSISPRYIRDILDLGTGLDGTGAVGLNFNGAVIQGDLDMGGRQLDFLRLVGTTIGGKLALADVRISPKDDLEGSGDIVIWDVSVGGIADFANVKAGDIAITGLEGAGFVLLSGAEAKSIMISESYGFDLVAVLRAKVDGDFVIRDVELATDLVLQGLSARSMAFENMKVGGQFDGVGMVVDGDVLLAGVDVGQELILSSSAFGGDLIAEESVVARSALTDATVGGVSRLAIQRHSE